ncbi:hypothetical protein NIA69_18295 [Gemmiger formicilis]|nr:hypothetical protein [Gemmiger formicilis]
MLVIYPGTMRRPEHLRASNAHPYKFYAIFSLFQFLQVFRQLVYVGVGESVGFGKGGYEVAGLPPKRRPHRLRLSAGRYAARVRAAV